MFLRVRGIERPEVAGLLAVRIDDLEELAGLEAVRPAGPRSHHGRSHKAQSERQFAVQIECDAVSDHHIASI